MADTNNNKVNNSENVSSSNSLTTATCSEDDDVLTKFSEKILKTYKQLALERGILSYELTARPIAGIGENAYGLILQVCLKAHTTETEDAKEIINILKISPKNPAYRAHGRIVDLYTREIFMYQQVFKQYFTLERERLLELNCNGNNNNCANECTITFDIVPKMLYGCTDLEDEFLIFEDLTLSDYKQNCRTKMPTFDLVSQAFRSIAKMHAMSFILQYKKPQIFQTLIADMKDNLFTKDMEPLSVEFGKKYIRKTRMMLEQDMKASKKQIEALQKMEDNFKQIGLKCVDGKNVTPYAVICHGDFWNNNILYKYNSQEQATSAKLIDFQISRYASPILDLVHYLYACTEKDLRNKHFMEFMEIYHQTLTQQIQFYGLNIEEIYPKTIFLQQLKDFGIFGLCMAAFSIPFFIANTSELPDLDQAAGAIREISSSENSDEELEDSDKSEATNKRLELLEEYDLLSERTLPIFKRRMFGVVKDLEKYDMLDTLLKL